MKRIAIGSKVFSESCSLVYQPGGNKQYFTLKIATGSDNQELEERSHQIDIDDSIKEMQYSISIDKKEGKMFEEEKTSSSSEDEKKESGESSTASKSKLSTEGQSSTVNFLAFCISKNVKNELGMYNKCYKPDTEMDLFKRFIVVEFHNNDDLPMLLSLMKNNYTLSTMLGEKGLAEDERNRYVESFVRHDERLKERRRTRSTTNKSYLRNVKLDEVVLNFPFDATYAQLDDAAKGLIEANGLSQNQDKKESATTSNDEKFVNVWKHSHIIRGEDYERLNPGEYLNDALIDLWMTWYVVCFLWCPHYFF